MRLPVDLAPAPEPAAGGGEVAGPGPPLFLCGAAADAGADRQLPAPSRWDGLQPPRSRRAPPPARHQRDQPGAGDRLHRRAGAARPELVARPAGPRLPGHRSRSLDHCLAVLPARPETGRRVPADAEIPDRAERPGVARFGLHEQRRSHRPARGGHRCRHPRRSRGGPRLRGAADGGLRDPDRFRLHLPRDHEPGPGRGGDHRPPPRDARPGTASPGWAGPAPARRSGRPADRPGTVAGPLRGFLPALAAGGQPGSDRALGRSPVRDAGHLAARLQLFRGGGPAAGRLAPDGRSQARQCRPRADHARPREKAGGDAPPGRPGRAAAGVEPDLPAHRDLGCR